MEKMSKQQKHFLKVLESQDKKKISLNLSNETVQKIDDLAKWFNLTRTAVLEALITYGLKPYLDEMETVMESLRKEEPQRKDIGRILANLKRFRQKWKNRFYD